MTRRRAWVVAVDGTAGSGKSSICAAVCAELGWSYINTGLLYRAVALVLTQQQVDINNENSLSTFLAEFLLNFSWDLKAKKVFWQGKEVTAQLATVEVGNKSSDIAKIPSLRQHLLPLQRQLAADAYPGVLLDGRDIGTVVFPDADLKVFMTASLEVRAERRLRQLQQEKIQTTLPSLGKLIDAMAKRDAQDSGRAVAPMVKAKDAVELDTSRLDFKQSIAALKDLIVSRVIKCLSF